MTFSRRMASAANPRPTYYGACPTNPGGDSLAAATTVLTKWGTRVSVRQFTGATLTPPNHPAGASVVHTTYKPSVAAVLNGSLDADITTLVLGTPDGDIIEFWHEPDNDGLTGQGITDMIDCKNYLYDMKQTLKPGVRVAATMTGGFFASYTSQATRDLWDGLRGDLVGVDCDGVHDATGPTYDMTYADELTNVLAFMKKSCPRLVWMDHTRNGHVTAAVGYRRNGTCAMVRDAVPAACSNASICNHAV
ncbi:hypothetical protein IPL68_04440 [Candidatus Saccharibacteria bacterium]|nr:MAG: hypothetical protein IPL68_04440 [Candidatus Saccharibacteria bacterium]